MIKTKPEDKFSNSSSDKGQRSRLDRRSGEDRRKIYSLDYFLKGGKERRQKDERRHLAERRSGWIRIDKWYSVFTGSD